MNKQRLLCILAVLPGALMILAVMWLGAATLARADPNIRCVNYTGTGCGGGCGSCYASIQAAINASVPGDEIHVADGVYTSTAGTVATISKELRIIGGYATDFAGFDPAVYHTVLDAQWGGSVISITQAGDVMLLHLTLTRGNGMGNYFGTLGCGGGIYVQDTVLHVGQCVITNNVGSQVGAGRGGGLCSRDSNVDVWESLIVSNTASADPSNTTVAYGGGIYADSPNMHRASLRNNQFLDNVGHVKNQGRGGGIYLNGLAGAEVLTNTLRGNKATLGNATSGWGGGLDIENCYSVYVGGNRIENNVTHPNPIYGGYGGGVYVSDSDVHLARNNIIGNDTDQGGGAFIRSQQLVTLSNNLIALNNAYGGVYVTEYYTPSVSRALLVNNTVADNGDSGIVASYYAIVTLTNNLIAGHATGLITGTTFAGNIAADTNLFWNTDDPITGTDGIREDPRLTPDFHLGVGSPAVNAGLTIPWLTTDLDGKPRTPGAYDIGAFEGAWLEVFLPLMLSGS
jgi:hypothetical protein